jgi:cyanate permease
MAATVLAALGLAQWPGRAWLSRRARAPSASSLIVTPLLLQSAGLALVALARGPAWATIGVATFGLGAGVHTLARPWLVQARFGVDAGACNGRVARAQGIARAMAPAMTVGIATITSTRTVLICLAIALLALSPLAARWGRAPTRATPTRELSTERTPP